MRLLSKSLFVVLPLLFLTLSLTLTDFTSAQVTSTPSVPQFTLKLVRHVLEPSSPTLSIDPFTGKQTIIQENTQFEWTTIDITIINQAFNGQSEAGLNTYTGIMYNVEFRGHFGNDWSQLGPMNLEGGAGPYFIQTSGATTLISVEISGEDFNTITTHTHDFRPDTSVTVPIGGEADFRIKAMAGNAYRSRVIPFDPWHFNGTESDWSSIQTITFNRADAITENVKPSTQTITPINPTPTLNPTYSPTVPELSWLSLLPLLAATLFLAIKLKHHIHYRKSVF